MLKKLSFVLILLISAGFVYAQQTGTTEKSTPLPADGGEPGKAYMTYTKAFASGDMAALKKLVSSDRAKAMDDPQFKEMFSMMQSMQPKEIKVTGGTMTSKDANLNVEAKAEGNTKTTGTVHMILEDKVWKVEKESWKSSM
jgi:hypothetical protein